MTYFFLCLVAFSLATGFCVSISEGVFRSINGESVRGPALLSVICFVALVTMSASLTREKVITVEGPELPIEYVIPWTPSNGKVFMAKSGPSLYVVRSADMKEGPKLLKVVKGHTISNCLWGLFVWYDPFEETIIW